MIISNFINRVKILEKTNRSSSFDSDPLNFIGSDLSNDESYTKKVGDTFDFYQYDKRLPNNGKSYCAPVSAYNSLFYLSNNGFPHITKGKSQIEVIKELGKYFETNPEKGTTAAQVCTGLKNYIQSCGYVPEKIEYMGWYEVDKYKISDKVDISYLKEALKNNSIILMNVTRYKPTKTNGVNIYDYIGSHWITLVGYDSGAFIIHDPAAKKYENTDSSRYIKLAKPDSGIIINSYGDYYQKSSRKTEDIFEVIPKNEIRKSNNIDILDGVIILKMPEIVNFEQLTISNNFI